MNPKPRTRQGSPNLSREDGNPPCLRDRARGEGTMAMPSAVVLHRKRQYFSFKAAGAYPVVGVGWCRCRPGRRRPKHLPRSVRHLVGQRQIDLDEGPESRGRRPAGCRFQIVWSACAGRSFRRGTSDDGVAPKADMILGMTCTAAPTRSASPSFMCPGRAAADD